MDSRIEKIKKIRQFLTGQVADLTDAQLNKVPDGFRNNIIWNVTHLISAQQAICYAVATLFSIIIFVIATMKNKLAL